MRTRKTFVHEEGIYEGVSRIPEPREFHAKKVVSFDDSYDWYPEKQSTINKETVKFEGTIDLPLGEEYKLKSQTDNYSHTNNRDTYARAALNEEINNMVVKLDFP
jgi:hypothetical protein